MSTNLSKTQRLTIVSILSAIICIISFLPLRTLGLEINFSMVPVAIGAILYGPNIGAILGGVFGTVSFIQCFGYSPFGAALLGISFWKTLVLCLPTRILAGFLCGLIAKVCKKAGKTGNVISAPVASLAAPLLNTVFFMSTLVLLFYNTEYLQGFADALKAPNPFMFIILFVGINGLVEIIAGFVVAYPATMALKRLRIH